MEHNNRNKYGQRWYYSIYRYHAVCQQPIMYMAGPDGQYRFRDFLVICIIIRKLGIILIT